MSQFLEADSSREHPLRKGSQIVGAILGLAICAGLFLVAMFFGFFMAITGPLGGGGESPLVDFILLAPVFGFVGCLVWLVVALVQKYRKT